MPANLRAKLVIRKKTEDLFLANGEKREICDKSRRKEIASIAWFICCKYGGDYSIGTTSTTHDPVVQCREFTADEFFFLIFRDRPVIFFSTLKRAQYTTHWLFT